MLGLGQLPYLVHDQHVVSSLPSIIKYVSDLRNAEYAKYPNANLDLHLSSTQKSQRSAWFSHAQNKFGDLVVGFIHFQFYQVLTGLSTGSFTIFCP